ncbi:MAG: hypothetical protein WBI53_11685 [Paludibacter sp.]
MKTIKFITAMLLSGCLFIGCNNENENVKALSKIEVKAQPEQAAAGETQVAENTSPDTEIVFTGDEIVSYNGKTGEIILIFKNTENPLAVLRHFNDKLEFYRNETFLFSLKSKIVSDIESAVYNEPVLHYSTLEGDKYYIRDGYPWGITLDERVAMGTNSERKTNAEKILSGWTQFVDVLKKEGKYVEN